MWSRFIAFWKRKTGVVCEDCGYVGRRREFDYEVLSYEHPDYGSSSMRVKYTHPGCRHV
jgi:hypothetical protein